MLTEAHAYSDFWQAYQGVFGDNHQSVGKETGQTAHIERWNNTRQRPARFVRKSLTFFKSDELHRIALQLFINE
ncbi:MAG: IS1 family transposase [Methylobacter sp.]